MAEPEAAPYERKTIRQRLGSALWLVKQLTWGELQGLDASAQARDVLPTRNKRKRDAMHKMAFPSKSRMQTVYGSMPAEPFGDPQQQERVSRPKGSAAAAAYKEREKLQASAKRALEDLLVTGSTAPVQSNLAGVRLLQERKPVLDRMARVLHGGVVATPDGSSLMARAEWPMGADDPPVPPMLRIWYNIGEPERYSPAYAEDRKALGIQTQRWVWHLLQQHDSLLTQMAIRHKLFRDDDTVRD